MWASPSGVRWKKNHPINVPSLTFCHVPFQSKELPNTFRQKPAMGQSDFYCPPVFPNMPMEISPFLLLFARKKWGGFSMAKTRGQATYWTQGLSSLGLGALVGGLELVESKIFLEKMDAFLCLPFSVFVLFLFCGWKNWFLLVLLFENSTKHPGFRWFSWGSFRSVWIPIG